ncbi:hypothetical protein FOA52_003167 [Chlamydomonas sp. UWO 241]|nr:hypothetical protein FOA52_003167 [Chlamydomonas sp. UWO 241]
MRNLLTVDYALLEIVYAGFAAGNSAPDGCGDAVCIECMHKWVCKCVDTSKYPVRCPSLGCSATLSHQDINWLLRHSPDHQQRFMRLVVESSVPPSQRTYCPYKDCSALLIRPDAATPEASTACSKCTRTMCVKCLIPG